MLRELREDHEEFGGEVKALPDTPVEREVLQEELDFFERNYADLRPTAVDAAAYYRRFATSLRDGGNNHRHAVTRALFDGLLHHPGRRVLDCACGVGQFAIWLALRGKEVRGFDISANAVAVARQSARLSGVESAVRFDVMDARDLGYGDGEFDLLTGQDCLHHLIKYPGAVRELARVLRPGGAGLFVEPLAWNPLVNLLRAGDIGLHGRVGEHILTRGDVRLLECEFGRLELSRHVVLSVFTRLLASTWRPLGGWRRWACITLNELDETLLTSFPASARFSAMAYVKLLKPPG